MNQGDLKLELHLKQKFKVLLQPKTYQMQGMPHVLCPLATILALRGQKHFGRDISYENEDINHYQIQIRPQYLTWTKFDLLSTA